MKSIQVQTSRHVAILLLILGSVLLPHFALSQLLQGTLNGTVFDPSQAAISGAMLTVINNGTSLTRETKTGSNGEFSMVALPPGTYTLKVFAPNYSERE